MLPRDALPEDWRMYYNNCWMRHPELGVGLVSVIGSNFYLSPRGEADSQERVDYRVLEMWWPRAQASNSPTNGAYFIHRKASRTMRKSATGGEHYYAGNGMISHSFVMSQLSKDKQMHCGKKLGKLVLNNDLAVSVAVSHNIILRRKRNKFLVEFRGILLGELDDSGKIIAAQDTPLLRLAQRELDKC